LLKWAAVGTDEKGGAVATKVDQPQNSDFETPTAVPPH